MSPFRNFLREYHQFESASRICTNLEYLFYIYAYKGTNQPKRLLAGQSPTTITIDYSLNELMPNLESLDLAEKLLTYTPLI